MLAAGRRSNRVRFERNIRLPDDGYGNEKQGWEGFADRWAAFRPKFGREQIEAGRPESTLLGTLTVLRDSATALISAADRVAFTSGPYAPRICRILSIVPTPDNREIEMTLEHTEHTI